MKQSTLYATLLGHSPSCFTDECWELLADMELVLLHKRDDRARCIELVSLLTCLLLHPAALQLYIRQLQVILTCLLLTPHSGSVLVTTRVSVTAVALSRLLVR